MKNKQSDEIKINLKQIGCILLNKAWILLLVGVICGMCSIAYCSLIAKKQYVSKTQIYVVDKELDSAKSNNKNISSTLSNDYVQIIKTRPVLEDVINELKLDINTDDLMDRITVSKEKDSRIISIMVKDISPIAAKRTVDAIAKFSAKQLYKVMDVKSVNVVQEGNIPKESMSPNIIISTLIMCAIGILLASIVVIIRFFLDDTIVEEEDVEKYLGLSVIGSIPAFGIETLHYDKGISKAGEINRLLNNPMFKKVNTKDIPIVNKVDMPSDNSNSSDSATITEGILEK